MALQMLLASLSIKNSQASIRDAVLTRIFQKQAISVEDAIRIAKSASLEEALSERKPIEAHRHLLHYRIEAMADLPYEVEVTTIVHAYTGNVIRRFRWLKH